MIVNGEPRIEDPRLVSQLMHSLCQPLTSVRCSLELALDQLSEAEAELISVALDQTARAIETARLIREYLEIEKRPDAPPSVEVHSVLEKALMQLSVITEAKGTPLLAAGTCSANLAASEYWLWRAFCYSIGTLIEEAAVGNGIVVLLSDDSSHSSISAHCLPLGTTVQNEATVQPSSGHNKEAKLAIARRVFESAGATFKIHPVSPYGLTISIPRDIALTRQLSA